MFHSLSGLQIPPDLLIFRHHTSLRVRHTAYLEIIAVGKAGEDAFIGVGGAERVDDFDPAAFDCCGKNY